MKKYQFDAAEVSHAWKCIEGASSIALIAHLRPDGDALSACGALAHVLKAHGKTVEIIYPQSAADPLPFDIKAHAGTHSIEPDLIICCDIANDERAYTPDVFAGIPRIIIDHHMHNEMEGIHRFVATEASSTCEIVYDLLSAWKQEITVDVANFLLFGILCDTLSFRTPNTTAYTLQVASELLAHGANLAALTQKMIVHKDPRVLMLWGELLSNVQHAPDNNAVWAVCTQNMLRTHECDETALVGFISMLSQTITADVTMLFVELPDGASKASLRGKTRDVRSIAASLGGGGHRLAAGISSEKPLAELVPTLIDQFC